MKFEFHLNKDNKKPIVHSFYKTEGESNFGLYVEGTFEVKTIKSIGIKYANISARFGKLKLIHLLWNYFENTFGEVMPFEPDPIPEFANDLQETSIAAHFVNSDSNTNGLRYYNYELKKKPMRVIKYSNSNLGQQECSICLETQINAETTVTINCNHQFCFCCIESYLEKSCDLNDVAPRCALCRTEIKEIAVRNITLYEKIRKFCES